MDPYVVKFYSLEHPDLIAREIHTTDMDAALAFIRACKATGLYNRCDYDGRINIDLLNNNEHR